jgi:hypothetical protein
MLTGIEANDIIVGAYVDDRGGVCPMLAAHRCGGRTSFAEFARAWDDFTRAGRRPAPATPDQLDTLHTMLASSMPADRERTPDVAGDPQRADTGERDRSGELRHRHGWAWLRLFRRYDDYAEAVARLEDEGREYSADDAREHTLSAR